MEVYSLAADPGKAPSAGAGLLDLRESIRNRYWRSALSSSAFGPAPATLFLAPAAPLGLRNRPLSATGDGVGAGDAFSNLADSRVMLVRLLRPACEVTRL